MPLSGREKATIFLSILGAEASAKILRYLPDEVADLIASGVNHLPSPSPDALNFVLEEFGDYMALPKPAQTFELGQSNEPLTPLDIMLTASSRRIASYLITERVQTIAFVLSFYLQNKRQEILAHLPGQRVEVESLLKDLKTNALSEKVKGEIVSYFSAKLA
ncbi:MAG: hypothetical protein NT099_03355 [Candidatus Saganbacteria bacterium]|nr:hypothetical protein [Candidatus Saganbacteria bacterium]